MGIMIVTTSQSLWRLNVLFQVKQLEECLAHGKPQVLVPDVLVTWLFARPMLSTRAASVSKSSCGPCPHGVWWGSGINHKEHNKSKMTIVRSSAEDRSPVPGEWNIGKHVRFPWGRDTWAVCWSRSGKKTDKGKENYPNQRAQHVQRPSGRRELGKGCGWRGMQGFYQSRPYNPRPKVLCLL